MNSSASTTRAASGCSRSVELPAFFREARHRRATAAWMLALVTAIAAVAAAEALALARLDAPVGRYWVVGARETTEVRP